MKFLYVTGNAAKFRTAKNLLNDLEVQLEQVKIDIHEIQSDSVEEISKDKAVKAYEIVKRPLIVNDSGWYFKGLNGFPGPYMKYVNDWFTAENFLDLTRNLGNREVLLKQVVVYYDGAKMQVFEHNTECYLLKEAKGNSPRTADNIVALKGMTNSLGEMSEHQEFRLDGEERLWKELFDFLKSNPSFAI